MVIIFILLLVLIFLFLLDKSMEKFLSISFLKSVAPKILCPKKNIVIEDVNKVVENVNKPILRDVDELMFSTKEGDTIYEYTSV